MKNTNTHLDLDAVRANLVRKISVEKDAFARACLYSEVMACDQAISRGASFCACGRRCSDCDNSRCTRSAAR